MKATLAMMAVLCTLISTEASALRLSNSATSTVTEFNFTGICNDCNMVLDAPGFETPATARLLLDNYTIGDPISAFNFNYFKYDGTNLLPSFEVRKGENLAFVSGSMDSVSGYENFYVQSFVNFFISDSNGNWFVGQGDLRDDDSGSAGTFTRRAAAVVPEPSTIALFGLGLLGFAAARRKMQK